MPRRVAYPAGVVIDPATSYFTNTETFLVAGLPPTVKTSGCVPVGADVGTRTVTSITAGLVTLDAKVAMSAGALPILTCTAATGAGYGESAILPSTAAGSTTPSPVA